MGTSEYKTITLNPLNQRLQLTSLLHYRSCLQDRIRKHRKKGNGDQVKINEVEVEKINQFISEL